MALPVNYIRANVVARTPDRNYMINVLWYKLPDVFTGNQTVSDSFAAAIDSTIAASFKAVLTSNSRYEGIQMILSAGGNTYNSTETSGADPGGIVADELPSYSAVIIQKRTAIGGKSGRGRWYVGGIPDTLTDEGKLTGGGQVLYAALASDFASPVIVGGDTATAQHFSPKGNILIPITSVAVPFILGTQRRRRLRPTL